MRLSCAFHLLSAVVGTFASPTKRQGPAPVTLLSPGSIVTPADNSSFGAGDEIPLSIAVPEWNHCHPGYTTVWVYILAEEPTVDSLNSTFQFSDYLYYYGEYMINNFPGELPNMASPPPPPSSLTMPVLDAAAGTPMYFSTIENIAGCPPDGFEEWAIDSANVNYIG